MCDCMQAAVRVSRLSRTATSSVAVALGPLHDNLALAPVCMLLPLPFTAYSPGLVWALPSRQIERCP